MTLPKLALLAVLGLLASSPASAEAERSSERELMVLTIPNLAEAVGGPSGRRIDRAILEAMRQVPRHLLVPEEASGDAYLNAALPIGHGATISQPYIVALMTQLLDSGPDHVVLEVGTGSGYQAAVLSRLVRQVYSIEIVPALADRAARDLARLGYANVAVRAGDGYAGWPDRAPFDRIVVTAGADHIPQPLLDQLRPGGVMVIPLGRTSETLELNVVRKDSRGRISRRRIAAVRFVPLVRAPPAPR